MPDYEAPDFNAPIEPTPPSDDGSVSFEEVIGDLTTPRDELLDTLHLFQDGLAETDESSQDEIIKKLGHKAVSANLSRFTIRDVNLDIMPTEYLESTWEPRAHTATAITVEKIMVRTPVLEGVDFGVYGESSRIGRDVSIAVHYKTGEVHMYLINDHTPEQEPLGYDNGRDITFDQKEMDNPLLYRSAPNVLQLDSASTDVPRMSMAMLHAMVINDSSIHQRPA